MAGGCRQDFSSITEAAEYGDSYQLGSAMRERIHEVYRTYKGWIDRYCGGITPISLASGMSWESRGNPYKFRAGESIKEIGLTSLTEGVARNLDVDPFDPEANIWAGAYLKNDRIRRIVEDEQFAWLVEADPYDWTKLTGKLPGSLGFGGWKAIMLLVFPSPPPPGSVRRIYPYDYMRAEILAHPGAVPKLGNMWPTLVACRIFRHSGVDFLEDVGQLHRPGAYRLIPRPRSLPRWNAEKFREVVRTPPSKRPSRFPEYDRYPGAGNGKGRTVAVVVAASVVLGLGGYAAWRYLR